MSSCAQMDAHFANLMSVMQLLKKHGGIDSLAEGSNVIQGHCWLCFVHD
jgi:hypothetical protein